MIITIEERGLRNQVNIDDDADATQMRTAFSRLLIARGHTFGTRWTWLSQKIMKSYTSMTSLKILKRQIYEKV